VLRAGQVSVIFQPLNIPLLQGELKMLGISTEADEGGSCDPWILSIVSVCIATRFQVASYFITLLNLVVVYLLYL
jgi:hypothetical protein